MASRRPVRRPKSRLWLICLSLLILVACFWGLGLRSFAQSIPQKVTDTVSKTDAIVVLTGGSGRIDEGVGLLLDGMADMLFVSGVYDGIDVRFLLETVRSGNAGIENKVNIGNATDTIGNAAETAIWIREKGYGSLRLVTAAYHMPRSLLEFSAELGDVEVVPHPVFPAHVKSDWWHWPGSAVLVIKEYNKFVLAWLRRQLSVIKPT